MVSPGLVGGLFATTFTRKLVETQAGNVSHAYAVRDVDPTVFMMFAAEVRV